MKRIPPYTIKWLEACVVLLWIVTAVLLKVDLKAQALDSLQVELSKNNLPDTARIDLLLEAGKKLVYSDGAKSRSCFQQAYKLADKNKLYLKMGNALADIGEAFYLNDAIDSALYYLQWADRLYHKETSPLALLSRIGNKMDIATVQMGQGRYKEALEVYLECVDSLNKMDVEGKNKKLMTAYFNIGLVYYDLKQPNKALDYHLKSLGAASQDSPSLETQASIKLRIADDYNNLNQPEKAYEFLKSSEKDAQSAKAISILAEIHGAWGKYYKQNNKLEKAIESFARSIDFSVQSGNKFQEANALGMLGTAYQDNKEYKKSLGCFEKALSISREIGHKVIQLHALKSLSEIKVLLRQDREAVGYFQHYIALSDSMNIADTKNKINEMENRYQAEKKQDSILVLQKDNQLQQLQLRKRKAANTGLIVSCTLFLLLSVLIYRNMKHRQHLLKQEKIIHTQRIQELEKERQLIAVQSVMKGQEDERSRLARDLHDGVGGLLSGVKLSLSTMKGNVFLSERNVQAVGQVIDQLDQSIAELRRVSHNMMPESLIKFGLRETLENYCEHINLTGRLHIQLQIYGMENRLEQSTEIVIYRIVQELLNNIIKHADAKNALVQLVKEENRFNLTVEDDGIGFDLNSAMLNKGDGLANVQARVDYLGGKLDIQSKPNEGTSIHIDLTLS